MKFKQLITFSAIAVCICVSALALAACGKDKQVSDSDRVSDEAFSGKYIVSAEYAKDKVGQDNVLFVDCRGADAAAKGTVKGAIATSWQELGTCSDEYGAEGDENWGKIPEASDFAERLGKLGITKDKEVILIAQTADGWGEDGRILWELREAGYENARLVDGGWTALEAAGVETQKGASDPVAVEVKIDKITTDHTMTTEELEKNYSDYKIVDVRTDDDWEGATKYGETKGGHLPDAVHIPYTSLFREDGTLVSNADIEKMLTDAGISKDDKIVAYCTGGIRSAYVQLVFEMSGYSSSYNYDQSIWRWAKVGEVVKDN